MLIKVYYASGDPVRHLIAQALCHRFHDDKQKMAEVIVWLRERDPDGNWDAGCAEKNLPRRILENISERIE